MNKRKRQKNQGFTLIETMVAALLLIVVIVGAARLMMETTVSVQQQQHKREAIVLANTVLERFWNLSYDDLKEMAGTPQNLTIDITGELTLNIDVTVTEVTDDEGAECLEIYAAISRPNIMETVETFTRRYQYGLSHAAVSTDE